MHWHVWRIDRESFGIQNLSDHTAMRVRVDGERHEVITMGYIEKDHVRPLEWFVFFVPTYLQSECNEITVSYHLGRAKLLQTVGMSGATTQLPSTFRLAPIPASPGSDVYLPPQRLSSSDVL